MKADPGISSFARVQAAGEEAPHWHKCQYAVEYCCSNIRACYLFRAVRHIGVSADNNNISPA
jgi:hypothetical protein